MRRRGGTGRSDCRGSDRCCGYRCGVQSVPASVVLNAGRGVSSLVFARFVSLADGWSDATADYWETGVEWDEMLRSATEAGFTLVLNIAGRAALLSHATSHGDAVLMVEGGWGDLDVSVIGQSTAAAQAMMAAFKALTPRPLANDAETVDVSFWSFDPMSGGVRYKRALDRLPFAQVERNYPLAVRSEMRRLASLSGPMDNGRLLIFHGPPGTGKSRALQTLASEWSTFCDVQYLVDPDMFFRDASYMNKVMLGDRDSERWRLVVAEDADEYIDHHAKHRVGYGVSRLLNMADGMVGQGLKVMVLISTNVPAVKFSKAVTRPGRCAGVIEFPRFTHEEAAEWLAADGITATFERPPTLAQLYAAKHGNVVEDDDDA